MRSLAFDFGTDKETKIGGKGIDWMLDRFLQKKELLNEKYEYTDARRILQSYVFHTLFLNMNIKIIEPNIWSLSWARFEFEIDESNASVLSFAPNVDGVKTAIEKNGSRELNLSLTGVIDLPGSTGSKISSNISYDKKNGWTVKFDATVASSPCNSL